MMRTAYIAQALDGLKDERLLDLPAKILHKHFGFRIVHVVPNSADKKRSENQIAVEALIASVAKTDVLLADETAAIRLWGAVLPCTKIMYLTEFAIMGPMDGFYDHYVSASAFVRDFHQDRYEFNATVIPSYIKEMSNSPHSNWAQRPPEKVLAMGKFHFPVILQRFKDQMQQHCPETAYTVEAVAETRPDQHLQLMEQYRYFLWLSPNEGFCLPLLEAMASGCTVLGFSPKGKSEFLIPGITGATADYPDFEAACKAFRKTLGDVAFAQSLAEKGQAVARTFTANRYENEWTSLLQRILN
jgi:hypothetical protein